MLYTNGIGATVDLPHLSVMPHGLDAWEPIYARRPGPIEVIAEPRLLELVRAHLGSQVAELRKPPWAPEERGQRRCPGCRPRDPGPGLPSVAAVHRLQPPGAGVRTSCSPTRTSTASGPTRRSSSTRGAGAGRRMVERARASPRTSPRSRLATSSPAPTDTSTSSPTQRGSTEGSRAARRRSRSCGCGSGRATSVRTCRSCVSRARATRGMLEATGPKAVDKLPRCRGRHAHLDAFYPCDEPGRLMMLGAANQWFPSTLGLLALPREEVASAADLVPMLLALPQRSPGRSHGAGGHPHVQDGRGGGSADRCLRRRRRRRALGGDPARPGRRRRAEGGVARATHAIR